MKVKIEDKIKEKEYLRIALVMAEMDIDYPTADLIDRIFNRLKILGGDYTVKDSQEILTQWKKDWELYNK